MCLSRRAFGGNFYVVRSYGGTCDIRDLKAPGTFRSGKEKGGGGGGRQGVGWVGRGG